MIAERRRTSRREFAYYMRVFDDRSQELIGHLADISPRGLQIDSSAPLPVNQAYMLRLELTADISENAFIVFEAHSRWSRPSVTDPTSYQTGFQMVSILPRADEVFQRIVAKYGSQKPKK
jgi:hypothetical protein